ncbi:hypothetical protein JOM56_011325 [Amanita muscaria]
MLGSASRSSISLTMAITSSACVVFILSDLVLTQTKAAVPYAGAVIVAVGVHPTIDVILALAGSSVGGDGVTLAIVIGLGNLGE